MTKTGPSAVVRGDAEFPPFRDALWPPGPAGA